MAYNDQIAISVPLKTEFKGAVPGGLLLSLLNATKAKDVEFADTNREELVIKAGGRMKLPVMSIDSPLFEMPEMQADTEAFFEEEKFFASLSVCLTSTSNDATIPDMLGITIIPNGVGAKIYATNSKTLSHAEIKALPRCVERVILPVLFCQQMMALSKGETGVIKLEINPDYALFSAGDSMLFGRTIHSSNPLDYEEILGAHLPENHRDHLNPIPAALRMVIERATIITDSKINPTTMQIDVRGDVITFESRSEGRGEVIDRLKAGPNQAPVSVKLNPKLMKHGIVNCDKFLITDRCAIMAKDNFVYLVAASS